MGFQKILVADDEYRMRKLVGDFLKKEGYGVVEAEDGKKALDIFFSDSEISLVVLDVMMPNYDGWTVCREIRKQSGVPVIMLTARSEESDELFGFELGADEYVTKPFSPKILVARVQALLRRAAKECKNIWSFSGLEIDYIGHNVLVNGQRVELTPKEYELLLYMAEKEGQALSRDRILNEVWNYNYFGDVRTVDTHIKKLRLKLGSSSGLIQTIRGTGYKFGAAK